jgi:hypothetical protein
MTAPPTFASVQEYRSRLGDIAFWWPYVAEILKRHDLADTGQEPLAGIGGTYPTFLHGDLVVKLFGYVRSWRESHAAERAAQTVIATDARDLDEEVRRRVADEVDARLANLEDSKPRRPAPNRNAAIDRSLHAVASSVSHCGFTPGQGDAHARW